MGRQLLLKYSPKTVQLAIIGMPEQTESTWGFGVFMMTGTGTSVYFFRQVAIEGVRSSSTWEQCSIVVQQDRVGLHEKVAFLEAN